MSRRRIKVPTHHPAEPAPAPGAPTPAAVFIDEHTLKVTAREGTIFLVTLKCDTCRGSFDVQLVHRRPPLNVVQMRCPHCAATIEYEQTMPDEH